MKTSDRIFALICAGVVVLFAVQRIQRSRSAKAWEAERQERIAKDFCRTYDEVKAYVARYIPDVTDAQMEDWSASNRLENLEIGGERRYFRNAGPNLFRIDKACAGIPAETETLSGNRIDGHEADDAAVIPALVEDVKAQLAQGAEQPYLGEPRTFHVRYTLTVDADAVPAGETVRCWLPYPRTDVARQCDVRFIAASEADPVFSRPEDAHSTLYLEKPAVAGQPTVFSEAFEYTARGEWHPLSADAVKPYVTNTRLYTEYTAEREAHIRFTPEIRALTRTLAGDETNPYLLARKFFTYVNDNFPWASAREYSTLENIPAYVLREGHGDCGMVTLLLITLCRCAGIPARWQSGFMMHPSGWNLHDWGEIYFEGVGWVPVDVSFGIPSYAVRTEPPLGEWAPQGEPLLTLPEAQFFYLGGIDPYRMTVNSDFGGRLYPPKQYPRSETVDFQRGEVEWKGGNLYFDRWSYSMEVDYRENR